MRITTFRAAGRLTCVVALAGLAAAGVEGRPSQGASAKDRTPAPSQPALRTETKHLIVTTSASASSAAPGSRVELHVDVEPKPRMHVYSPEQKDYIPVSFTIEERAGIRAGAVRFPKAEKYFFAPLKETQLVYSKPFRLTREITVAPAAAAAEVTVKGTVRYQACDDAICYVPQNVPVSWTIAIKR